MKTLIKILILTAFSLQLTAQIEMAKKSIFARYDSDSITDVKVILPGDVEIETTRGTQILLDIEVTTNLEKPITEAIFKRGRYTLTHKITSDGTLIIEMKIPENDVIVVKGTQLEESIKSTLYIPELAEDIRHVAKK